MKNIEFYELFEQLVREAYNTGYFEKIHSFYVSSNWSILCKDGKMRIPSIYDIEDTLRSLADTLYLNQTESVMSAGLYIKKEIDDDDSIILSFGFDAPGPSVIMNPKIKIVDQNGNNLKINKTDVQDDCTTYVVNVSNLGNKQFNDSYKKLMKDYKSFYNKKAWGDLK
jgi:hypothetical protein